MCIEVADDVDYRTDLDSNVNLQEQHNTYFLYIDMICLLSLLLLYLYLVEGIWRMLEAQ